MGLEHQRDRRVLRADRLQGLQHRRQAVGVIAAARGDDDAEPVGFQLVALVEAAAVHLGAEGDQLVARRAGAILERHRHGIAGEAALRALLDRFQVVLAQDVHDLMAEHPGELGLVAHALEQAAGDENRAARHREGIDVGGLEHAELPRQVGTLGLRREPAADMVDVALHARVGHQRRRAQKARGDVLADRDLLGLVDFLHRLADVLHGLDHLVDVEARHAELRLRAGGKGETGEEQEDPHFGYSTAVAESLPCVAKPAAASRSAANFSSLASSAGLGWALAICSASRPRTPVVTWVPLVPVRATLNICDRPLAPGLAAPAPPRRSASIRTQPSPLTDLTRIQPLLRSRTSTAVCSASAATVSESLAGACLRSVARITVAGSASAIAGRISKMARNFMSLNVFFEAPATLPVARGL